jgi:vesicle coat complex subunit
MLLQDSTDGNPIIRALSLRAMSKIARDKAIKPYAAALKKSLKVSRFKYQKADTSEDSDPYVVKTAVLQVIQLSNKSYAYARDAGLIKLLVEKVESDGNPNVVANSLLALKEIFTKNPEAWTTDGYTMTREMVSKFLATLDECTEWATVAILGSLKVRPRAEKNG